MIINYGILLLKLGLRIYFVNFFKDQRLLLIRLATVMFRAWFRALRKWIKDYLFENKNLQMKHRQRFDLMHCEMY